MLSMKGPPDAPVRAAAVASDEPVGDWTALWGASGDYTGTLTVPAKTAVLLKTK